MRLFTTALLLASLCPLLSWAQPSTLPPLELANLTFERTEVSAYGNTRQMVEVKWPDRERLSPRPIMFDARFVDTFMKLLDRSVDIARTLGGDRPAAVQCQDGVCLVTTSSRVYLSRRFGRMPSIGQNQLGQLLAWLSKARSEMEDEDAAARREALEAMEQVTPPTPKIVASATFGAVTLHKMVEESADGFRDYFITAEPAGPDAEPLTLRYGTMNTLKRGLLLNPEELPYPLDIQHPAVAASGSELPIVYTAEGVYLQQAYDPDYLIPADQVEAAADFVENVIRAADGYEEEGETYEKGQEYEEGEEYESVEEVEMEEMEEAQMEEGEREYR